MKKMMPALALVLAIAFRPAQSLAATLADFLSTGYEIGRVTTVSGMFHGCIARRVIIFSDGSTFECAGRSGLRALKSPSAYFLRFGNESYSAVTINGEAFDGTITKINREPQKLSASSTLPGNPATTTVAADQIAPIAAVQSITQLQNRQTTR